MRLILLFAALCLVPGCAIKTEDWSARVGTDNLIYGSGTVIGVQIGVTESSIPVKATVGYEKYEFISKPKADKANIDIQSTDVIGVTGTIIERHQRARFGDINSEEIDVTINGNRN